MPHLYDSKELKDALAPQVGRCDDVLLSTGVARSNGLGRGHGEGFGEADQILCCGLPRYVISGVKCLVNIAIHSTP